MNATDEDFQFLSTEEFNRLTQSEKMEYLARAVATLNQRSHGSVEFFDSSEIASSMH